MCQAISELQDMFLHLYKHDMDPFISSTHEDKQIYKKNKTLFGSACSTHFVF